MQFSLFYIFFEVSVKFGTPQLHHLNPRSSGTARLRGFCVSGCLSFAKTSSDSFGGPSR
jgi:hypothetical protein